METKFKFTANYNNGTQKAVEDALNIIADAFTKLNEPISRFLDDDEGREVLLEDAELCFAYFRSEMMKRAVLDSSIPLPLPIELKSRLQITNAVKYDGLKLKTWIDQTYGSEAGINFKILYGMYNEEFLLKYFPDDAAERAKRLNRFTLFIAPYLKTPHVAFKAGAKAYNLGGLEP